jgi:glycine/serine hydroxymethyltransferase
MAQLTQLVSVSPQKQRSQPPQEEQRQRDYLNLIASENFMSTAVLEALGSVVQSKYSSFRYIELPPVDRAIL